MSYQKENHRNLFIYLISHCCVCQLCCCCHCEKEMADTKACIILRKVAEAFLTNTKELTIQSGLYAPERDHTLHRNRSQVCFVERYYP